MERLNLNGKEKTTTFPRQKMTGATFSPNSATFCYSPEALGFRNAYFEKAFPTISSKTSVRSIKTEVVHSEVLI